MKPILILTILFFFVHQFICAQHKDSTIQIARNQNNLTAKRIQAYEDVSRLYLMDNDSTIIQWTDEAVKYAQAQKNLIFEGNLRNNLGSYYSAVGDLAKAIQHLQQAENCIIQVDKQSKSLLNVYINISQVFLSDGQAPKALTHAEKGLQIAKQKFSSDSTLQANLLYIKGWAIMEDSTKIQEAPKILKQALIYADNQTDASSYFVILNSIAAVYSTLNISDSTIKYAKLCLSSDASEIKGGAYLHLASTYHFLHKHQEAIPFYHQAIEQFKITQNLDGLQEAYLYLSKCYHELQKHDLAYQFLDTYSYLHDSLQSSERKESLAKLEIEYETFRKDASIKELDLQSSRKSIIIGFILGISVLVGLLFYFQFSRYKSKKENEMLTLQLEQTQQSLALEKKAAESELKALKSQMNPHFIFNALNGIQEQFMYGDKRKANEQLENFTWLTRQILSISGKKKISIQTELELLQRYLDLEKMRFDEGFSYKISLSENIDEDYHSIPPMIIQPFVENAIKHGLLHKKGDKKLDIQLDWQEEKSLMAVTITDNGIGRKQAETYKKQTHHESFSTYSVEQRLQLLAQSDNFKAFEYHDLVDEKGNAIGTQVILNIPC